MWPRESLADAVPRGEYDVRYELSSVSRSGDSGVASDTVRLRLP